MACPTTSDGGESLQIWRVAANILNKQSQTADMGWSSSMAGVCGGNISIIKKTKQVCYEMLHRASDLDGFFGMTKAKNIWTKEG
jgi:hypothetical protein